MRYRALTKISLLSLIVLVASFTGFSKEKIVESAWVSTPVKVDGMGNDWAEGSLNSEDKVKVEFGFKNDAKDLYVIFLFKDRKYMSSLQATGITLWVNTEGKKKMKYGILFKDRRLTADELIARMENQQGPMPEDRKKQLKANQFYFLFSGEVIDKKNNLLTQDAMGGEIEEPIFRMKPGKDKTMSYEFKIPLRILEKLSADYTMEPGKMLKVGFEWGGWSKELKGAAASRMGQSSTKARGDRASDDLTGRGGDPRSVSRMRMSDRPDLAKMRKSQPKKYTIWVDVKLAQNQ